MSGFLSVYTLSSSFTFPTILYVDTFSYGVLPLSSSVSFPLQFASRFSCERIQFFTFQYGFALCLGGIIEVTSSPFHS